MWMENFYESMVRTDSDIKKVKLPEFLKLQGFTMDKDIEYSMVLLEDGNIAATGSFAGNVLKCISVDEKYTGLGLSARVVTHLANEQHRRGRDHLFIFTKPGNKNIFFELGFYPIAEAASKVLLMENRQDGIDRYLERITAESGEIILSAAVVVNCNPFTLGHRYLLDHAASRCRKLHVFVVWEDKSVFPSEIRYRLVKEGIRHLPNVVVHKGEDYIISNATFPSYFLKEYDDLTEIHARLDLEIFSKYISPKLDIRKRFVGNEPFCTVTAAYNKVMKEVLPAGGVEIEEVPRLSAAGGIISASRVRQLIRQGDLCAVRPLVPDSTYGFLLSAEAKDIIERIQSQF